MIDTPHDLGSGHSFVWIFAAAEYWPDPWPVDDDDEHFPPGLCRSIDPQGHLLVLQGIIESHTGTDGQPCQGGASFTLPIKPSEYARETWQVLSLEPLHIEPSLACRRPGCESHGSIRGGQWEPC